MPLNPSAAEFKPASQPISIPLPDDPWAQEAGDVSVLPLLNVMLTVQYGPGDLRFVPLCGEFSPRSLEQLWSVEGSNRLCSRPVLLSVFLYLPFELF